jgi:hypothetical protein
MYKRHHNTYQPSHQGAHPNNDVLELGHKVLNLSKYCANNPQEPRSRLGHHLTHIGHRSPDLANGFVHHGKLAHDRVNYESRIILEILHRTIGKVLEGIFPHQSRQGHVRGITAVHWPIILEILDVV